LVAKGLSSSLTSWSAMIATNHNGSRRDVLLLLDSSNYIEVLNTALSGTGTVISMNDVHRPIGSVDDREYELPEFSREYLMPTVQ
jgi:hypothetical protein